MKEDYIYKNWFSLNSLANFCAEYTKDGKLEKTAWGFIKWLDRKCAPKKKPKKS